MEYCSPCGVPSLNDTSPAPNVGTAPPSQPPEPAGTTRNIARQTENVHLAPYSSPSSQHCTHVDSAPNSSIHVAETTVGDKRKAHKVLPQDTPLWSECTWAGDATKHWGKTQTSQRLLWRAYMHSRCTLVVSASAQQNLVVYRNFIVPPRRFGTSSCDTAPCSLPLGSCSGSYPKQQM
jgi:hypothetical protein